MILTATDLHKTYPGSSEGAPEVPILSGVSLSLDAGQTTAIVGPSGCGKSTLLNLLGTLDTPDSGTLEINGRATNGLSENELAALRAEEVGFVFQAHHLLPQLSALENVLLPTLALGKKPDSSVTTRGEEILKSVGLNDRLHHRPGQLSGGERQRTAIARSLINQPALLLADEPTGALDETNAQGITTLLADLAKNQGLALAIVTHDPTVANHLDQTLHLEAGSFSS